MGTRHLSQSPDAGRQHSQLTLCLQLPFPSKRTDGERGSLAQVDSAGFVTRRHLFCAPPPPGTTGESCTGWLGDTDVVVIRPPIESVGEVLGEPDPLSFRVCLTIVADACLPSEDFWNQRVLRRDLDRK